MTGRGFRVVEAEVSPNPEDVESALLVELTRKLGFSELGVGGWAAFGDRLWDLLTAKAEPPVAIVVAGLTPGRLHAFVRRVHNVLSLTEAVGLSDDRADRQVEYFFLADWE
ncbi:hypothetical protein [Kutzneria buriramensis]|nr:hypothetical protein [Kutzneria buriramensis]